MSLDVPGFADPVLGAQSTFRAVLDAMSRPGSLHRAGEGLAPPPPLARSTAAVLLTLVDADTKLHAEAACAPARDWIAFHCGADLVADPDDAAFTLALSLPSLHTLPAGTDDAPEDGTTLILQVAALDSGQAWLLSGPGLASPVTLRADGLPPDFASIWAANHALYPRGVDLILCAGEMLTALPRSVRITDLPEDR
jgi:alpha-D-ribose 1-methylphosphonate 5-triphosphate synthase subunit PhnH